jgi:hypothetical protein
VVQVGALVPLDAIDVAIPGDPAVAAAYIDALAAATVSSLGDANVSLGDAKSSLGDAKSSLGDAKSSLGDV